MNARLKGTWFGALLRDIVAVWVRSERRKRRLLLKNPAAYDLLYQKRSRSVL